MRRMAMGVVGVLWLCSMGAMPVAAGGAIESNLSASKVVRTTKGEELLRPATDVRVGDLVEYQALYRNESDLSIFDFSPVFTIPQGMRYDPKLCSGQALSVSVDGEHWVRLSADGQALGETEIRSGSVRFLKLHMGDLGSGEAITARFRLEWRPARKMV